MKVSCPEPKIMTVLSPLGAMQQHKQDGTNPSALVKIRPADFRLCDVPSHESLDGKKGEEPATPVGTGYGGVEGVRSELERGHLSHLGSVLLSQA